MPNVFSKQKNDTWRYHICEFSEGDHRLAERLSTDPAFNISKKLWNKTTKVVDTILEALLDEAKHVPSFERLEILEYVRQGSSREGLKVGEPDEFDTILPYKIKDLKLKIVHIDNSKNGIPGLSALQIRNPKEEVKRLFPTWIKEGVFCVHKGRFYLHSKLLNEKVFTSIIDRASRNVEKKFENNPQFSLGIKRTVHPPSVNILLNIEEKRVATGSKIAVDIVPGLVLDKHVQSELPTEVWREGCRRFALFKWLDINQKEASDLMIKNPQIIWKIYWQGTDDTVVSKLSQRSDQMYILTSLRILKAYLISHSKTEDASHKNSLFPTRLNSFHLKTVTMYCLLFLTIRSSRRVTSVKEALGYLLSFVDVCLKKECLPHFFHGNGYLGDVFAEHRNARKGLRLDLLRSIPSHSVNQCKTQLRNFRRFYDGLYIEPANTTEVEQFTTFIQEGVYYRQASSR